jgi:hypothetical protein
MTLTSMLPFSKAISVTAGAEEINILLTDTNGSSVDCNFIRVDSTTDVGPGGSGYFYVRPAGLYSQGLLDPSGTGTITDEAGAGVASSGPSLGSVTIRTGGRTFSSVDIGNAFADTSNFVITYGYEQAVNPLASHKTGAFKGR